MLGIFIRVLLALTATAPISISLAYIFAAKEDNFILASIALASCFALGASALKIMHIASRKLEALPINIVKVKSSDKEVIGFVVAYALPLLFKGQASVDMYAWLLAGGMLVFVLFTTHSMQVNPVLGFFGYHFYDVETKDGITYLLISKRKINNVKSISKIVQLSEYGILELNQ